MTAGRKAHYDVAILGGGPAGTATALALRRHAPRLSLFVAESSDYGAPRIGESLPPQTRPLLEHLGVWEAFEGAGHARSYGTAAAWGDEEPYENEFVWSPYREGWHLERNAFDAMLARRAAERGAVVETGCTWVDGERRGAGWRLHLRRRGEPRTVRARFVVDASGRRACFAGARGARRIVCDRLLGLYVFFELDGAAEAPSARTLIEAWEEGWWYSARLPGDRVAIACMSDADRIADLGLRERQTWMAALAATRHTRRLVAAARAGAGPSVHAAHSQQLETVAGEGWLAVGDAASTFDPLSSQGIFKALRFAIWAAYAASDHLAGKPGGRRRYARLVEHDFDAYLTTRMEYYRQETRWPRSLFWRRRAGHITLDPAARLQSVHTGAGRTLIASAQVEHLHRICRTPRVASEVVAELRGSAAASDHRIILALQQLLAQGALKAIG